MSYESIDKSSANDTFEEIKNRIFTYCNDNSPDIKERVDIEKKLKIYLKTPQPQLALNFIIECINAVDEHR